MPTEQQLVPTLTRKREAVLTKGIFAATELNRSSTEKMVRELSDFSKNNRKHVADAIVLLAHEASGRTPVLAPDFELLHAYLYPSQQSDTSTVPPARARYVLDLFPGSIVLLPGTVLELIRHATRVYSGFEEVPELRALRPTWSELEGRDVSELAEYAAAMSEYESQADEVFMKSVLQFKSFAAGVQRLQSFLLDARVLPLRRLGELDDFSNEVQESQTKTIHARIVVHARRQRMSQRDDAANVAWAAAFNRASAFARGGHRHQVTIATETSAMLEATFHEFFPTDCVQQMLEEGVLIPEYLGDAAKRSAASVCHAKSLAFYIRYRRSCRSAQDALNFACEEYRDLMELATLSARMHLRLRRGNQQLINRAEFAPLRRICSTYWQSVPVALASTLQLRDLDGLAQVSTAGAVDWLQSEPALLTEPGGDAFLIDDAMEHVVHEQPQDLEERLSTIGIRREEVSLGDDQEASEVVWRSELSGETLLTLTSWHQDGYLSVGWDTRVGLEDLLEVVSAIATGMDGERFAVAASYDLAEEAETTVEGVPFSLPGSYRFICTTKREEIAASHFWQESPKGVMCLPEVISCFTEAGEYHFTTPFGVARETSVLCNLSESKDTDEVLRLAIAFTHCWRWNAPLVRFFEEQTRVARRSFLKSQRSDTTAMDGQAPNE